MAVARPHRVLQCIDFTVERLNLPPGLVGLLLGLPQGVSVALCRLSQIIELQEEKMKHTVMNMCLYVHVRLSVCEFVGLPWTCTSPRIPACSSRQWSHTGPWCPSEHLWGRAWRCFPLPSSADGSAHSLVHPGFPDNTKRANYCQTVV